MTQITMLERAQLCFSATGRAVEGFMQSAKRKMVEQRAPLCVAHTAKLCNKGAQCLPGPTRFYSLMQTQHNSGRRCRMWAPPSACWGAHLTRRWRCSVTWPRGMLAANSRADSGFRVLWETLKV